MAQVRFTRHLARYFPDLAEREEVSGGTVAEVVAGLDERHPGLAAYIVDEGGTLRKHVNIFLGQELIHDRNALSDVVGVNDQVFIFQALSGGCGQTSEVSTPDSYPRNHTRPQRFMAREHKER